MNQSPARLVLKPGRDKSLRHRHPWIFSGAIARVEGEPGMGDTVSVHGADGAFLAWAAYGPSSQIRARVWSFDPSDTIDEAFLERRVAAAIARRKGLEGSDGMRIVHGESDGLPGLVADRYADCVVVQVLSAGAERWRDAWPRLFAKVAGAKAVFERSDVEVRTLEGLKPHVGPMLGETPAGVRIREDGIAYDVDVVNGQKTGFYLDQRDNRALARSISRDADFLNAFSYTGGFSLAALAGGAKQVTSVDTSEEALAQGQRNAALNGFDATRAEWVAADVFTQLRKYRDQGRRFDAIVLDPPKFAPTEKHVANACRAYKDINLWAMKILKPGGHLFTFSCSGAVDSDLFRKVVAGAAADAQVDLEVRRTLGASADHAVSIHFPEGEYLKGLWLQAA